MAEREHFIQTQVFAGGPKKDIFILHCAHLIVPLAPPKVLTLGNENKKDIFILHCAHLIVPLQSQKAANNGKKSFDNRSRGIHWRISGG